MQLNRPAGLLGGDFFGLAAAWTNAAGTWVLTLDGSKAVPEEQRIQFAKFANSIRVGSRESVLAWLPNEPVQEVEMGYGEDGRTVGFLSTAEHLWMVRFYHDAPTSELEEKIAGMLNALEWSDPDGEDRSTHLVLPESMKASWGDRPDFEDCAQAWHCADVGAEILAVVHRLEKCSADRWRDCANAYAGHNQATPWTQTEWRSDSTTLETQVGTFHLVRRE